MNRFLNQNYYEILEIRPDASYKEIGEAYRRAKETYSGESLATYSLFTQEECKEIVAAIEAAYSALSFSKSREEYDRRLSAGISVEDIKPLSEIKEPVKTGHLHHKTAEPMIFTEPKDDAASHGVDALQHIPPAIKTDAEMPKTDQTAVAQNAAPIQLDGVEFRGSILKIIRERRGISLNLLADKTKININYLENIEAEKYHQLPSEVFLKGYLSQYAKFLSLDAKKVVEDFMRFYEKR